MYECTMYGCTIQYSGFPLHFSTNFGYIVFMENNKKTVYGRMLYPGVIIQGNKMIIETGKIKSLPRNMKPCSSHVIATKIKKDLNEKMIKD